MDKRIAQASTEIMILMGFLFLMFIVFLIFINTRLSTEHTEKEAEFLKDISHQVQSEIRLAYSSKDGYMREFTIPEKLENKIEYDIQVINTSLLANTSNHQYVLTVPQITGNVIKGNNQISKINQSLILN